MISDVPVFSGMPLSTSNFWDGSKMLEAFSIFTNEGTYSILIYLRYIFNDTTEQF